MITTTSSNKYTMKNSTPDYYADANEEMYDIRAHAKLEAFEHPSDAAIAMASFTECMLQLEGHFQSFFPTIAIATHPLPYSVKIVGDQYYVLLSLATIKQGHERWGEEGNLFACNGVDGATALPFTKKAWHTLMVKCPQSLHSTGDGGAALETFTIKPYWNDSEYVEYNIEKFSECEQKDIAAFADRTGSRSIKTGITATFAGQRDGALEWAIYHHLLGFDHIWIYVNEPWENGHNLFSTDFLTFIPYNNHAKDMYQAANVSMEDMRMHPLEVFRLASHNDALYRASRMGLEWMAFLDLDEIVVLGAGAGAGAHSNLTETRDSSHPLQNYLTDFKATHGDEYGAIFLQSVPFGRSDEGETELELQIDYTWRQDLNLSSNACCRSRNKLLLEVPKAISINIHYYLADRRPKMYYPNADELRINHYKNKDRGVFNMRHRYLGPPDIMEDTQLRDQYRDRIVQNTASIKEEKEKDNSFNKKKRYI